MEQGNYINYTVLNRSIEMNQSDENVHKMIGDKIEKLHINIGILSSIIR